MAVSRVRYFYEVRAGKKKGPPETPPQKKRRAPAFGWYPGALLVDKDADPRPGTHWPSSIVKHHIHKAGQPAQCFVACDFFG